MTRRQTLTNATTVAATALVAIGLVAGAAGQAPAAKMDLVTIDAAALGPPIAAGMFGVFFEDINFAADGGLYPERVKNRSFEFTEPLTGWRKITRPFTAPGELVVRSGDGINASNPHYLRLRGFAPGTFGVGNAGFRGMGLEAGAEYVLSAWVRVPSGSIRALSARLTDDREQPLTTATLSGFGTQWKRYETTFASPATHARAQLELMPEGEGEIDIDMVSIYPKATWGNRPNGLRKDLVQLLAEMKPGFLRFPGGCIVEGRRLALRYDWKKTVGDVNARVSLVNRWNDEFGHRPAPDYYQSFGLGFYEYFQLAEDIGASPLPIVSCGMACQFNSGELAPLEDLDPYIQDALDLIEFANGPVGTRWGALRAAMGHPAPFNLKMLGVGNEQWGPRYIERYERFAGALKKTYPEIALVSSAGPAASGDEFTYLWRELRRLDADLVDEHYYMAPKWFLDNAGRYDAYDRKGPKVFAGEYAAQTAGVARPENRNNWEGAIAEAAFMTGLERNADVVRMASYAPLFAHVDAWQWTPNLIWFDNLRSYATPNYYVQKLYATNQGTHVLKLAVNGSDSNAADGLYTSASLDQPRGEVIVKIVNATPAARTVRLQVNGSAVRATTGTLTVLASADLAAENSLEQPTRVSPSEKRVTATSGVFELPLDAQSFSVLRVKAGR